MVLNRIEPAIRCSTKRKKQRALDRCTRRHNHLHVHYNKIPYTAFMYISSIWNKVIFFNSEVFFRVILFISLPYDVNKI